MSISEEARALIKRTLDELNSMKTPYVPATIEYSLPLPTREHIEPKNLKSKDKLELMKLEMASAVIRASTERVNPPREEPLVKSPIEQMLLMALLYWRNGHELEPLFASDRAMIAKQDADDLDRLGLSWWDSVGHYGNWFLFAQVPVDRYTLDFAIVSRLGRIVVECDEHDFHERTKEQAKHDRQRDRALQLLGWKVLRFTGSEIYADAHECVAEILEAMDGARKEREAAE